MSKPKIPPEYRHRLERASTRHGFASGQAFAQHLIDKGLKRYQAQGRTIDEQLSFVVESAGYSSEAELVEHLLEGGLSAYEDPVDDPAKLAARLRGLGYIE